MVEMTLSESRKLILNFDLGVIYQPFELKIGPKVGFKRKQNACRTSGQLPNSFQTVQRTTFLDSKMVKMVLSEDQNMTLD